MGTVSKHILHAYCDAMLNEKYYRHVAARHRTYDIASRWVALLCSSSAALVVLTKLGPSAAGAASLVATAATLLALVLRSSDKAHKFEALAAKWTNIVGRLRLLDLDPEKGKKRKELCALVNESEALQAEDTSPRKTRLAEAIQREITTQLSDRFAPAGA